MGKSIGGEEGGFGAGLTLTANFEVAGWWLLSGSATSLGSHLPQVFYLDHFSILP